MSDVRGRLPKNSGHHSFGSRDYEDIDCKAVGCRYNAAEKCMVPSRCRIGEDGRCRGFEVKPPPKVEGD